jgi:hypothetical protein
VPDLADIRVSFELQPHLAQPAEPQVEFSVQIERSRGFDREGLILLRGVCDARSVLGQAYLVASRTDRNVVPRRGGQPSDVARV